MINNTELDEYENVKDTVLWSLAEISGLTATFEHKSFLELKRKSADLL